MEIHHLLEEGTDLETQLLCSRIRVQVEQQDRKRDKIRLSDRHLKLLLNEEKYAGRQAGRVVLFQRWALEKLTQSSLVD